MIVIENIQNKINYTDEMKELIEKVVHESLANEKFEFENEVSITFVDNEQIREINREYRNIDKPTDVLSFPILDITNGKINTEIHEYDMDEGRLLLGDIIVSLEKALEQSKEYGHSFERELAFLISHGMYHLLGYDHMNEQDEKMMMAKQEKVLEKLGLKR